MIEFTQDGPFADKADTLFPDRVRIIGLGQTGAAVCDQIVLHGRAGQDLCVFDSDQMTIEGSIVPNRHLLGRGVVHGLGCNGDLDLAREIVLHEENRLSPVARGCDFLILIVGLAGATGVALAERLIELGREAGAKVIVVGVQPFGFEGWARRERAVRAIADLRSEADSVLVLSHDRLAEHPETRKNIRNGFHLMHQMLAKTAQALSQVVCKRGLIQLSFADVRSLYGRYAGAEVLENCWVGHVEGTIRDCTEEMIADLLEGPLLENEAIWKQIDHAIVAVSGTRDLGLSDVQELVTAFMDQLPVKIPIATSASLDEENHDRVRLSVLFAMTAPMPAAVPERPVDIRPAQPPKKTPLVAETVSLPDLQETAKLPLMTTQGEPPKPRIVPRPQVTPGTPPKAKPAPVAVEPVIERLPEPVVISLPLPELSQPVEIWSKESVEEIQEVEEEAVVMPEVIASVAVPEVEAELEAETIEEEEPIDPEPVPVVKAVAPKSKPVPATVPVSNPARTGRRSAKQEEMQFEPLTRGRFEKTHETMYRGENLDQPTFRRRGLKIRV